MMKVSAERELLLCGIDSCSTTENVLYATGIVNEDYENYLGKRLTNVVKTVMTSSRTRCATLCSRTDGCLAVNVIGTNDMTCELTTDLGNENEMEDDHNSELLVLGNLIYVPFVILVKLRESNYHCQEFLQTIFEVTHSCGISRWVWNKTRNSLRVKKSGNHYTN